MKTGLIFALAAFCANSAPAVTNDWLIVPGERLGPITASSTRADLDRFFGKASVKDEPVDTGEGPEPATVIFPGVPATTLAIVWRDDRIAEVEVCFGYRIRSCKWHTTEGVSLGTSVEKLEALNGRPFEMEQPGTDVGGNIVSWQGGRLENPFVKNIFNRLLLTLDQDHLMDTKPSHPGGLRSDEPEARRLHPKVIAMRLEFSATR